MNKSWRLVQSKVSLVAVVPLLVLLVIAGTQIRSSEAHAGYDYSEPAAGATVTTPPTEVVLFFTQEVRPGGFVVAVLGPDGNRIDLQDAELDLCDASRKRVTVSLPSGLQDGEFTVQWQTMSSEDGEEDSGFFTFTLNSASGSPVASPSGSPAASPAASPDTSPIAC